MKSTKLPIVEIEWIDSSTHGGWSKPESYKGQSDRSGVSHCRTTGYLLERNTKQVIVVQSTSDDAHSVTDSISIPAGCVKRVRKLK